MVKFIFIQPIFMVIYENTQITTTTKIYLEMLSYYLGSRNRITLLESNNNFMTTT